MVPICINFLKDIFISIFAFIKYPGMLGKLRPKKILWSFP